MVVKLVNGKFVTTGEKEKATEKKKWYQYEPAQFGKLVIIAKADGLEIANTKGADTKVVNQMVELVIDAFIADREATPKHK